MSDYPEHDKLQAVQGQTQPVGEFLEWAEEEGLRLMCFDDGRPYAVDWHEELARWVGVDLDKIEQEKRRMLAACREMNRGKVEG